MDKNNEFMKIKREHMIRGGNFKNLFKESVNLVEIETFSYCNRQCWFCPNHYIDRHTRNYYMSEECYINVLRCLSEIDYDGMISYSRYNEPLADKIILRRIAEAKEYVPLAKLHTNTNGDYITRAYLEKLYDSGLRSINIQAYQDRFFSDEIAIKKIEKIADDLNLKYEYTEMQKNKWFEITCEYNDMNIRIYSRNFLENGCNRGEALTEMGIQNRLSPCTHPFYAMYIDYNGNVVPCCNIRSDIDEHKKYILGNVNENDIFEIYGSEKSIAWRKAVFNCESDKISPCKTCNFALIDMYENKYQDWIICNNDNIFYRIKHIMKNIFGKGE